jgi:hypothetical protein
MWSCAWSISLRSADASDRIPITLLLLPNTRRRSTKVKSRDVVYDVVV